MCLEDTSFLVIAQARDTIWGTRMSMSDEKKLYLRNRSNYFKAGTKNIEEVLAHCIY